MAYLALLFSTVFLTAFSCKERKPIPTNTEKPFTYVQKNMQDSLKADLSASKSTETVLALYSSGGLSDAGQYIIRDNVLQYTKPNSKTFSEKKLTEDQMKKLTQSLQNWIHYENYTPKIADGVRYNFIYLVSKDGKVKELKKMYINNPGVHRDGENQRYKELTDFFMSLADKDITL